MKRFAEMWRRVVLLCTRDRVSRELDAELRFHLDMAAEEHREAGVPPSDAAFAARRQFGNVTQIRERAAEAWGWTRAEQIIRDVGFAARTLVKRPTLALVTIASLGLGIGSVSAVFLVLNALVLRPPAAVASPESLVAIYTSREDGTPYGHTSFPDLRDLAASSKSLTQIGASEYDVIRAEDGARYFAERVTGNYFELMGARPAAGRAFLAEEADPGRAEDVVVISHSLWQRRFGGNADAVGATLRLNGRDHTVIGVAPAGLASRFLALQPDLWVPIGPANQPSDARADRLDNRVRRDLRVVGRLAPGQSIEQVRAELAVMERRLHAGHPGQWQDPDGRALRFSALSEWDSRIDPANRTPVLIIAAFFGVVSLMILLAASTNVMSMFLAEVGRRRREMAVRLALGASRGRVVALLVAQGILVGLAGGFAGLYVAAAGLRAAAQLPIMPSLQIRVDLSADWRVLAATVMLSILASLAFSLAPAIQASRLNVSGSLKREAVGLIAAAGRFRLRDALIVVQFAAALVLVSGATLMVRSLHQMASAVLGIDPSGIAVTTKRVPAASSSPEAVVGYLRTLAERLAAEPDVAGVAISSGVELASLHRAARVWPAGADPQSARFGIRNDVAPGYLEFMGVAMRRGRTIQESDVAGAPPVAVVNEPMAEQLWPGVDPIGRRFALRPESGPNEAPRRDERVLEVVGVVRRGAYWQIGSDETPYFWTAIFQECPPGVAVSLKGRTGAGAMVSVLREHVPPEADEVRSFEPAPLTERIAGSQAPLRVAAQVLGWGGAFALVLAVIGVYGAISFTVARRTRELAVRLAVGAAPAQVMRGVLLDGLKLALVGAVAGTAVGVPLAWLVRSELYGVSPLDPIAFGLTSVLLVAAALAGSYLPARRALRIDPVAVLKEE